jgi:DNA-binding response OmpR family regulator
MKRRKRILVVEDDDAIRTLLVTVLNRRGFLVDAARDGAAGMELLARGDYALLLLDLMMPRMSGWEVMDILAEWAPEKRPVIIILTAGTEPRAFRPNLVSLTIRKPFDVDSLADAVAACLSIASPSRGGDSSESKTRVDPREPDRNHVN